MAYIGQIPEFNAKTDDWNIYSERLEQFFEVNDFPDVKRSALLINLIGADSYKTLRDLCHPELPKDKSFEDLVELLKKHFMPQISVFRERIRFYQARQKPNENITSWYARLKKLSIDCRFHSGIDDILLDRFVCGLKPSPIVDRLCEEDENLTLPKALEIALAKESSVVTRPKPNPVNNDNRKKTNENQPKSNVNYQKKFTPRKPENQCNVNVNVVAAGKTTPTSSSNNNNKGSNNSNKKKPNKD